MTKGGRATSPRGQDGWGRDLDYLTDGWDLLAQNLEQYFEVSQRHLESHGFKKVPRKAARHHLNWLVQHRVCRLSCKEIADWHAERNPQPESPGASLVAGPLLGSCWTSGLCQ